MKKFVGLLCCGILSLVATAHGRTIQIESTTLFSLYEESATGFDDELRAPAYEFLRADIAGENGLGFHLYGWGSAFLDDTGHDGDSDFTYGYLSYRGKTGNSLLKAGRFHQYQITGVEQLDGISAAGDLAGGFRLTAYAGAPTPTPDDNKGDLLYGGQLDWRWRHYLHLGVSALAEDGVGTNDDGTRKDRRQLLGGMVRLSPSHLLTLTGDATYNTVTDATADQHYALILRPAPRFSVTAERSVYAYDDYFASSDLAVFRRFTDGEEKLYGATATLQATDAVSIDAFYKHFSNQDAGTTVDGKRFGGQLRYHSATGTAGVHYARSDGDTAAFTYDAIVAYLRYRLLQDLTLGLRGSAHLFEREIYGRDTDYLIAATAGYAVTDNFSLDGTISYEESPRFDKDVRGYVWLNYRLDL